MAELRKYLAEFFDEKNMSCGKNNEIYVNEKEESCYETIRKLSENEVRLINLFCAENFEKFKGFTLFYVFEKKGFSEFLILRLPLNKNKTKSIAKTFAAASWFEREIQDGFGITFINSPDSRSLFLHEVYPENFHPLLKSFRNQKIKSIENILIEKEYKFNEVRGEGIYQIPVGPVHAGIIEPGHFRFSVIGETIYNLEIRMFYKHRGIEKIAEGLGAAECVRIAESISGDETIANAFAYCNAIEKISGIKVSERASYIRTILLEMERIYSLLGDMAGLVVDVAYPAGASTFFILREEVLRLNEELTGSRFMKDFMRIGGLKKDIEEKKLDYLASFLKGFSHDFNEAIDAIHLTSSAIDRFDNTGIIQRELVDALSLSGQVARASGIPIDTRADHPYGIYDKISLQVKTMEKGDVLSRFEVKAFDVIESIRIILKLLREMPKGEIVTEAKIKDGFSLSCVESARGMNLVWVCVKKGKIDRFKARTASFCNWQSIEQAILGNIVPDFPLINKSLNLSYAGTDL